MLAANKVLHKIAMVPMAHYVLFLAFMQTFGYVVVYGAFLTARTKKGIVTERMLAFGRSQWATFVQIGLCEALFAVSLFEAVSNLPGAVIPVFSQGMLVWNFLLSTVILRKRFEVVQYLCAGMVAAGGVVVAGGGAAMGASVDMRYAAVYFASMGLVAYANILKERTFERGREAAGKALDVFVVNTFGSMAQAAWTLLLAPLIVAQRGVDVATLPGTFADGARLLAGGAGPAAGFFETWGPLLYICWNIAFNIVGINALRSAGIAAMSLVMSTSIPLGIYAFTFTLPLLGPAPPLGANFWAGSALLMAGLLLFNLPQMRRLRAAPQGGAAPA